MNHLDCLLDSRSKPDCLLPITGLSVWHPDGGRVADSESDSGYEGDSGDSDSRRW